MADKVGKTAPIVALHGERGTRQRDTEQLDLFRPPARIHTLPTQHSPFEEALLLDDRGSEQAKTAYVRAIEAGDNVADAACNLGILLSHDGDALEAAAYFRRALQDDPTHLESHFNLANVFLEHGWYLPAEVHYRLALAHEPGFLAARYNLALTLMRAERLEEAVLELEAYRSYADVLDRRVEHLLQQLTRHEED